MKNWKTSLLGVLGGLMMLFGPRLSGDATAPPITGGNVGAAVAIALLGLVAKDKDVTGGTRVQSSDKPAAKPLDGQGY